MIHPSVTISGQSSKPDECCLPPQLIRPLSRRVALATPLRATSSRGAAYLAPVRPQQSEVRRIMTHSDKASNRRSCCPLTSSKRKRDTARKMAATVKDAFPPGVAQPALRALAATRHTSLDQLTTAKEDLMALHGMGPKAMGTLRAALKARGKSFRS